ncbi:winged helix-turn-helix transcriptional regulator [Ruminiclostridium herbifermentans]|uniref:Winged helix-turn-helix transcriptional regulator n=1 Tax=Ruminiclostridium herbifermentans TaxID=2488810 RepID=A0A4U7J9G8_9FIRM|nr:MarR family winged helix-turn-helix transcriptional regulator [Ruminiclostridium herbifermentans]QNU65591.1 winged helix-turn-helix transcriptional regulator [Ruminiclostridium herbifermentans]
MDFLSILSNLGIDMNISFLDIARKMNTLSILHRINIQKQASKNGLYFGQPPILEYVASHNYCTQREVADFMKVSPASISTSVKRMQKAGLIEKLVDDSDLRYNRLKITEKGKELTDKCRKDFDKVDAQMFAGFSDEECQQLYGYYERMIKNLSTDEFEENSIFSLIAEGKKLFGNQNKEEIDID